LTKTSSRPVTSEKGNIGMLKIIHAGLADYFFISEEEARELAGQLTALYPKIRLLFMSGYTANVIAHQGVLDKGVAFIQKPFSMQDIAVKVHASLKR
jgi:FixJ family two-component response regulator